MNTKNEELDLIQVIAKLYRLIVKRFTLVILCFSISVGLAISTYFFSEKVYQSEMVASTTLLGNIKASNLILTLNSLISNKNYAKLSALLNISEEDAQVLREIKPNVILSTNDNFRQELTTDVTAFSVEVYVTDPLVYDTLEKGIKFYLQNTEFVKIRSQIRRTYYDSLTLQIENEIQDLQNGKKEILKVINQNNTGTLIFSPSEVAEKIIDLYKQKFNIREQIILHDEIQIVKSFTYFSNPDEPKLNKLMFIGLLAGVVFSLLLILIVEFKNYLKSN